MTGLLGNVGMYLVLQGGGPRSVQDLRALRSGCTRRKMSFVVVNVPTASFAGRSVHGACGDLRLGTPLCFTSHGSTCGCTVAVCRFNGCLYVMRGGVLGCMMGISRIGRTKRFLGGTVGL